MTRRRWFVKDLAALQHSAPASVTRAERMRFLRDYLADRGIDREVLGAWARRVVARANRMARHAPKHSDPRTARPPGRKRARDEGDG